MLEARLTERQREFAEANYKVLEDFLRYRNLPMDEFYDVVVFRFLWAVKQYDEREDLKQYSFKTIAKNYMRSALENYFEKKQKLSGTQFGLSISLQSRINAWRFYC